MIYATFYLSTVPADRVGRGLWDAAEAAGVIKFGWRPVGKPTWPGATKLMRAWLERIPEHEQQGDPWWLTAQQVAKVTGAQVDVHYPQEAQVEGRVY